MMLWLAKEALIWLYFLDNNIWQILNWLQISSSFNLSFHLDCELMHSKVTLLVVLSVSAPLLLMSISDSACVVVVVALLNLEIAQDHFEP